MNRGSVPDCRNRLFCSQKCPHRLWGPPSLLLGGYRGFLAGVKGLAVQLTLHHIIIIIIIIIINN
jgi:hypothetical protein